MMGRGKRLTGRNTIDRMRMILNLFHLPAADDEMTGDKEPFARTAHGSALFCGCCGKVEVTLGNAVLCLAPDDLPSVLEVIDAFDPDTAPDTPRRSFVIRTEGGDAAFAFHRREILELRELVRRAGRYLDREAEASDLPRPRFARSLLN